MTIHTPICSGKKEQVVAVMVIFPIPFVKKGREGDRAHTPLLLLTEGRGSGDHGHAYPFHLREREWTVVVVMVAYHPPLRGKGQGW